MVKDKWSNYSLRDIKTPMELQGFEAHADQHIADEDTLMGAMIEKYHRIINWSRTKWSNYSLRDI